MNFKKIKFKNTDFKQLSSNITAVLQKFGRGLMLPISILPFAGLLLGIGGAIGANISSTNEVGLIISRSLKAMSEIVFANLAILFTISIVITFTNESGSAAFLAILGYLVFNSTQAAFIHYNNNVLVDVFYIHKGEWLKAIIGSNLGITSLQTSLFGSIIVGIIIVKIYNKFKYIQLPNALSFFSGIRFLPILIIPSMFLLGLLFLIVWPYVGFVINQIGIGLSKTPTGVDGFIYGVFGRALMPFGLHHILITLAYQTQFGGILEYDKLISQLEKMNVDQNTINQISEAFKSFTKNNSQIIIGDQNIWNFINSIPLNNIQKTPIFQWFSYNLNINAGRFTQDYPTYLGTCMGIGLAFILTSNKETRKQTASVILSAMGVSFLTGITEPLEFTFLFITPVLYYAVYVPFSGLSYLFMSLVNAHVGVGFARGFIDLIVYGALPVLKGTRFYWAFVFALIQGLVIFVIFYFWIIKKDLPTPGRKDNVLGLISKKDYQELKNKNNNEQRILEIIKALGTIKNIKSVSACATRLRVEIVDQSLVNIEELNKLGSHGNIIKNNNIQVIFGGEATILSEKINNILNKK
ncbi:PTS transporter subunit EIIC [Mycoplasma mycoides]|uniref:PTS transporter subunit EIIC n=1 Tax=Mycoplasma mycoides TaxID=2102 RepID=UPI00045203A2|nr:PTS transporter subunit EIIC [Mycoplasma mycoides]EXU60073.1 Phosphotransferase system PTS, glucose-specific IIBC component [Mycoplasma mycoides subsp. capri PG3]QVK04473.1 PTS transporter subunit EIIC [Mycoplasma mycoides subsp. capri]